MRLLPSNLPPLLQLLHWRRRPYCSSSIGAAAAAAPPPPKLKNLCYRHRSRALRDAQRALTEYLHSTRSLPFSHAENIAGNAPFSLSALVSQIPFPPAVPPADIPRFLRRFLSYRPVNEFDFFFESIGLPPPPQSPLFLSDDPSLLAAVSALAHFGFPWTRLGLLYRSHQSIFRSPPDALLARLHSFESFHLPRVCLIAVCLAFPFVLVSDDNTTLLFQDLTKVFLDYGLADQCAGEEDNVDLFLQICRRIRVFYDSGSKMGAMGDLMGRNRRIFLELEEAVIAQKLNFFLNLGMAKDAAGPFILQHPEILSLDLLTPGIAMPHYLKTVGMDEEELGSVSKKYPYAMGKNRLGNLPGLMRALDLDKWLLRKIVDGSNIRYLSPDCATVGSFNRQVEDEFLKVLEKVKSSKKNECIDYKLEFLLGIGFGENKITSRAVGLINSTREQLQERFECLRSLGIGYPMLCRMISAAPKLMNQSTDMLHEKVNYLSDELGYTVEYLDSFPAYLCYDLENRIKPRYKILNWLKEKGLLRKHLSPATVLANSEKRFIVNLSNIHPAAPKQWLEIYSSRIDNNGNQKVLFLPHPDHSKS